MSTSNFRCLPLDLITQILIRLPVESIVKYMCVCKEWYFLIKSPVFIETHLSHSLDLRRSYLSGCENHCLHRSFYTLRGDMRSSCLIQMIPEISYDKWFSTIGSIHGLICLITFETIFIWNPLLKRYLRIPYEVVDSPDCARYAIMGFGFDSPRNDYKLVKIVFNSLGPSSKKAEVFSLKEWSWKKLDIKLKMKFDAVAGYSCFTNGLIHWLVHVEGHLGISILSFDVSDECFNIIDLPTELVEIHASRLFISKTRGLLSIFCYNDVDACDLDLFDWYYNSCDIWVRKEHDLENSWTKICKIELEDRILHRVLEMRDNGEVLIEKLKSKELRTAEMAIYDPKTKGTKHFGVLTNAEIFYFESYYESLILLDRSSEETVMIK